MRRMSVLCLVRRGPLQDMARAVTYLRAARGGSAFSLFSISTASSLFDRARALFCLVHLKLCSRILA